MARSFFRNVADQITGGSSKTTDVQIAQGIDHFEDEHSKLSKFKREFDKYTQATLLYDNASYRFFNFISSLIDSTRSQHSTLVQTCMDVGHIRAEHLQNLNKQITTSINISSGTFEKMKGRINEQNRIQHDYDKTRKQYQSSIKRDEQLKLDRIKNELDQLKSALNLINNELRDELPKFFVNIQNDYIKIVTELFNIHGQYYKNFHKLCSGSKKKLREDQITNSNNNEDSLQESQSSNTDSNKKKRYSAPLSRPKRTDYKILYEARVTHDYKSENEDELNLIKDEYISVISFHNEEDNDRDKGWDYAEKADGTIGLFPVNFVMRLYDNEEKQ